MWLIPDWPLDFCFTFTSGEIDCSLPLQLIRKWKSIFGPITISCLLLWQCFKLRLYFILLLWFMNFVEEIHSHVSMCLSLWFEYLKPLFFVSVLRHLKTDPSSCSKSFSLIVFFFRPSRVVHCRFAKHRKRTFLKKFAAFLRCIYHSNQNKMNITFNRIEQKNRAGLRSFSHYYLSSLSKSKWLPFAKMWKIIYFFFEEIHCYIMPRLPSKSEYDVEQFEKKKKNRLDRTRWAVFVWWWLLFTNYCYYCTKLSDRNLQKCGKWTL